MQVQQLKDSLRSVQVQLSETSNLYIAQGDKLREVRRSRLELDQQNTTLNTALTRSKVPHHHSLIIQLIIGEVYNEYIHRGTILTTFHIIYT